MSITSENALDNFNLTECDLDCSITEIQIDELDLETLFDENYKQLHDQIITCFYHLNLTQKQDLRKHLKPFIQPSIYLSEYSIDPVLMISRQIVALTHKSKHSKQMYPLLQQSLEYDRLLETTLDTIRLLNCMYLFMLTRQVLSLRLKDLRHERQTINTRLRQAFMNKIQEQTQMVPKTLASHFNISARKKKDVQRYMKS